MSSSTREQEAQAVERAGVVGRGERDAQRAVAALRDARVRRPGRRREDELRAVVEQPQRPVADAAERHAQVVRAARPDLDQRRHGTSSGGRRRRVGEPGRDLVERGDAREPRAQTRLLVARQAERRGHVEPRGGDVHAGLQERRAAAAALRQPHELAVVRERHELVRPRAGEAGEPRRGAIRRRLRGGLAGRHRAQLGTVRGERREQRLGEPAIGAPDVLDHERVAAREHHVEHQVVVVARDRTAAGRAPQRRPGRVQALRRADHDRGVGRPRPARAQLAVGARALEPVVRAREQVGDRSALDAHGSTSTTTSSSSPIAARTASSTLPACACASATDWPGTARTRSTTT